MPKPKQKGFNPNAGAAKYNKKFEAIVLNATQNERIQPETINNKVYTIEHSIKQQITEFNTQKDTIANIIGKREVAQNYCKIADKNIDRHFFFKND